MRPESLIEEYYMNNFSQVVYVQEITSLIKGELRIKEMLNVSNRDYTFLSGQLMAYAKKSFV